MGRDSPAGARPGTLKERTRVHTHSRAGWHTHLARTLPRTRLCPRAHAHSHAQTQTRAGTLTPENFADTRSQTHGQPAPPGTLSENSRVFPNSSLETRAPAPSPRSLAPPLSAGFPPGSTGQTTGLVAMATPDHPTPPPTHTSPVLTPLPRGGGGRVSSLPYQYP